MKNKFTKKNFKTIYRKSLPIIGIVLVIYPLLFFDKNINHPSIYTLSTVIGVCLILWFANSNEIITKILSIKLIVGIGLISYSLYLWHYPIFSYSLIYFQKLNIYNKLFIFFIFLFFSLTSYFLIEKPFRNKELSNKKKNIILIVLFFVNVISYSSVIYSNGYINRMPEFLNFESEIRKLKDENGICFDRKNNFCHFNKSNDKIIYLLGDSHMAAIMSELNSKISEKNYSFKTLTVGGCIFTYKQNNYPKNECTIEYINSTINELSINQKSIIIIGGHFSEHIKKNKTFENNFIQTINKFINYKNKIILVYPTPVIKDHKLKITRAWKNRFFSNKKIDKSIEVSYDSYKKYNFSTFIMLDGFNSDSVSRVYPHTLFCNSFIKNQCVSKFGNKIFYDDDDHFNAIGAEMVSELILHEIER